MSLGEIEVQATGEDRVTLQLTGEFDLSNVLELEAVASKVIGTGVRDLCLDVRGVTFMDSSMLNLLVKLRKRLRRGGGAFRIQPNLKITKLLEMTGLGDLFDLVDAPESAEN